MAKDNNFSQRVAHKRRVNWKGTIEDTMAILLLSCSCLLSRVTTSQPDFGRHHTAVFWRMQWYGLWYMTPRQLDPCDGGLLAVVAACYPQ
jgi:hypothetical protein